MLLQTSGKLKQESTQLPAQNMHSSQTKEETK